MYQLFHLFRGTGHRNAKLKIDKFAQKKHGRIQQRNSRDRGKERNRD